MVAFVIYRKVTADNLESAKEATLKYLDTLLDKFEEIIIKRIKDINFSNLGNLAEIERGIINDTIDAIWNITVKELENYTESENTEELIRLFLNKEFITNFVKQFFEQDKPIQEVYTSKYNEAVIMGINKSKELEEEISKQNFEYETEDISKLPKVEPVEEEPSIELIPPTEEEKETINISEDNSVEEVE
jgi:hypothetical protein